MRCPYRVECVAGQGLDRKCEGSCQLFVNLPQLVDRARQLDPLVGQHEEVLREEMCRIAEGCGECGVAPLKRNYRKAAKVLAGLMNV